MPGMNEGDFRDFITNRRWRVAKTMPHNPHAYTIKSWVNERRSEFEQAVRFIRDHGQCLRFGRTTYRVYLLDGYRYWAMAVQDPDVTKPNVLNRAVHHPSDESRLVPCPEQPS